MVYNHGPYLRKALDGILMQQVDFDYEIVIGDDFSQDDSFAILKEYEARHPDKIRVLERPEGGEYQRTRQRLGRIYNFTDITDHCKGKYIAILDGDDYWVDPEKLQIQVDFMEQHPEFSICFHQAREFSEDGSENFTNDGQPEITDAAYLLEKGWHMRTASIVFRRSDLPPWPEWVYNVESMDYALQCLLTFKGQKIKYIDRCMCDYRLHPKSNSAIVNKDYLMMLRRNLYLLTRIRSIQTRPDYLAVVNQKIQWLQNETFYQYRAKKNKTVMDWKLIIGLGFELGKFNPSNIISRLAGQPPKNRGTVN